MKMKTQNMMILRSVSILLLFAFFTLPLFAQPPQGQRPGEGQGMGRGMMGQQSEEAVTERVENLAKSLEFTAEQKNKLMDFEMGLYKKNAIERQKLTGDREAMMTYMQEQRELRDKTYAEIMTKEQMAKFQELQQNRGQQRPGQGPDQGEEVQQRGRGR
jgi:hypothetical protein